VFKAFEQGVTKVFAKIHDKNEASEVEENEVETKDLVKASSQDGWGSRSDTDSDEEHIHIDLNPLGFVDQWKGN